MRSKSHQTLNQIRKEKPNLKGWRRIPLWFDRTHVTKHHIFRGCHPNFAILGQK
jgi:hypothetical protein